MKNKQSKATKIEHKAKRSGIPGLTLLALCVLVTCSFTAGCVIAPTRRAYSNRSDEPKWNDLKLWYDEPAMQWTEALPLGNGRLGAMVFGGIKDERLQLNEKSVWSGSPDDADNPQALAALHEVRRLTFESKYAQANTLASQKLICKGAGSGYGSGANVPFGCYQTLGDLMLKFDGPNEAKDYRRELNLDTAIAKVTYCQGDAIFKREIFSSVVEQVLVVRLICDKPGRISFTAELTRPERFTTNAEGANCLTMTGQMNDGKSGTSGLKYIVRLRAISDGGRISTLGNTLRIEGADTVTLLLTAGTDYKLQSPDYRGNPHERITAAQLASAADK
jgi:alpha-L-fucosidase 2